MRIAKRIYGFLLEIYNKFNEHNGTLLAAGIAFFTFFSLFPVFIFIGIALGFILADPAAQERALDFALRNIPVFADLIRDTIEALIEARSRAGFIAVLGLLWASTGLFGSLAAGLNAVYEVSETRNIFRQRLVAVGILLLIILLLLVSFGAASIASVFRDEILRLLFPAMVAELAWTAISVAIGFVSAVLLFYVVYKFVPNVKVTFRNIWPGTILAVIAWQVANYVFAIYVNAFARAGYGLVYGSLATIILFMFWLYISAVLLLIGAEINVALRRRATGGGKTFEHGKAVPGEGGK